MLQSGQYKYRGNPSPQKKEMLGPPRQEAAQIALAEDVCREQWMWRNSETHLGYLRMLCI